MTELSDVQLQEAVDRIRTGEAPILDTPKPGNFYRIQFGKGGLMTTTGKAYGVSSGGERMRLAQRMCNHPLNADLLVPAKNAFERQFFPGGILSFRKQFTATVPQRVAERGERKQFGIIYIPSLADGGPFDPTLELRRLGRRKTVRGAFNQTFKLLEGDIGKRKTLPNLIVGDDDRKRVTSSRRSRAPFRWVCKVVSLFPVFTDIGWSGWTLGHGSGVMLNDNRMLTNAHVLSNHVGPASAVIVIPGFSKKAPPEATDVDEAAAPFGVWCIARQHKGVSNFHVTTEYRKKHVKAADFATVDFRGAKNMIGSDRVARDGWLSVSSEVADVAPVVATPDGSISDFDLDPVPTRKLLRLLGSEGLFAAGYPFDRLCEMMLAKDRLRPLQREVRWVQGGETRRALETPDFMDFALLGNRLDTTFGNSGGPVWVEREVTRRVGNRTLRRKQFVLAGLVRAAHVPVQHIDLENSTRREVVKLPDFKKLDVPMIVANDFVALTPAMLEYVLNPRMRMTPL